MILNALSGQRLPVYGAGANVRDWIYVEDHCRAVRLVFEKGKPGETYAVGAGNERKNIDLVNQICGILDEMAPPCEVPALHEQGLESYSELITFVEDRPGHDYRYAIDSAKIAHKLGWQVEVEFEAGLRHTVEWYLSNPQWVDQVSGRSYSEWIEKNYTQRGRARKEKK
jgi:dTDP-glucose 4,6-dehydratase